MTLGERAEAQSQRWLDEPAFARGFRASTTAREPFALPPFVALRCDGQSRRTGRSALARVRQGGAAAPP